MHDTPDTQELPAAPDRRGLAALIADLRTVDPADAPPIADAVAARLESELAGGAAGSTGAEV